MSKFTLSLLLSLFVFSLDFNVASATNGEDVVNLINSYRRSKGLSTIPKSTALFKVANAHTTNQCQSNYNGRRPKCWNPHSWEDMGQSTSWKPCCYSPFDGNSGYCIWDKPKEIANFNTEGYEISTGGSTAASALNGWKRSSSHNDVILQQNSWKYYDWKAIGCAGAPDRGGNWNCWFANERDNSRYRSQGEPYDCRGSSYARLEGEENETETEGMEEAAEDATQGVIAWILGGVLLVTVIAIILYCLCSNKRRKGDKVSGYDIDANQDEDEVYVIKYEDGEATTHDTLTVE